MCNPDTSQDRVDIHCPIDGVLYPTSAEVAAHTRSGAWLRATLPAALREAARVAPGKAALVSRDGRLTFAEWDDLSERLAAALLSLGLRQGDRALFQMGTVNETAVALFACFKAGIIPVCTLPQHREVEIGNISARVGAAAHFVQGDFSSFSLTDFALAMARRQPSVRHIVIARSGAPLGTHALDSLIAGTDISRARQVLGDIEIGTEDVATLQLSGGTTGSPKLIPRFHSEYLGSAHCWANRIQMTAEDKLLWTLPLIHNAGQILVLVPALLTRATVVLMQRMDPSAFFEWIERERVSILTSIGPIASAVLDYPHVAQHDRSSLRLFLTLDRAELLETHLGVKSMNIFGITEGLLTTSDLDAPPEARFTSVGYPVSPGDEIQLLDPDGDTAAPPGEIGELAFRGPSTIRAYYKMPFESQSHFTKSGFFRSGDLMKARQIGGHTYYSFEGRIKDIIDRGGEKFSAGEVELFVAQYPGVADAKVVPMADRRYGEKACAFVVMRAGCTPPSVSDLGTFLLSMGLAKFKIPERIEHIEALPVTATGKVSKAALRSLIVDAVARGERLSAVAGSEVHLHHPKSGEYVVSSVPFTVRRRVRWRECDPAGVVYTVAFSDFVMSAAELFYTSLLGEPLQEQMDKLGFSTPTRALSLEFHRVLHPDEEFEMVVSVRDLRTRTFVLEVGGRTLDGTAVFGAILTPVCVAKHERRAITVPSFMRQQLLAYRELCNSQVRGNVQR
jgi:non-ribosomal peptide synthetase component E (peptide arylation enzyme)/acyl-CoA thioesterase FadM